MDQMKGTYDGRHISPVVETFDGAKTRVRFILRPQSYSRDKECSNSKRPSGSHQKPPQHCWRCGCFSFGIAFGGWVGLLCGGVTRVRLATKYNVSAVWIDRVLAGYMEGVVVMDRSVYNGKNEDVIHVKLLMIFKTLISLILHESRGQTDYTYILNTLLSP